MNEGRADNRPSNLVICQDNAYHRLIHYRLEARKACGHADWYRCVYCGEYGPAADMWIGGPPKYPQLRAHHQACRATYERLRKERERTARRSASCQ